MPARNVPLTPTPVATPTATRMAGVIAAWAIVRYLVPGFHYWPGAEGKRSYLGQRHRHLFHVEARVTVTHDEREVEFHDLLDLVRECFPGGELGPLSCEAMARSLIHDITSRYPGREVIVAVFEDGEAGAELHYTPRRTRATAPTQSPGQ